MQLFGFTPKDDIVRPGKVISPRQAMEAAQAAVAAGEQSGRYIIGTKLSRKKRRPAMKSAGH